MEFLTFLGIYIGDSLTSPSDPHVLLGNMNSETHMLIAGGIAIFIFVSLFGDSSAFRGTPVHWLHWLLTKGSCQGFWYAFWTEACC